MKIEMLKIKKRAYDAPECVCHGLNLRACLLDASPFVVTTEHYGTPDPEDDSWI